MSKRPARANREDLKSIASYIGGLPPVHLDNWRDTFSNLDPDVAANIQGMWTGVGKSLAAFYAGEPSPVSKWNLSDVAKQIIKEETSFYGVLSLVMFEAEEYIRLEAKEYNLAFVEAMPWRDFVKLWALEDCREMIWVFSQDFWESQSPKNVNSRLGDLRKIMTDEMSQERADIIFERWDKEDSKLYRPDGKQEQFLRPWSSFCLAVFSIYRNQIPSMPTLESKLFDHISTDLFPKKCAVKRGRTYYYPGRGKSKAS